MQIRMQDENNLRIQKTSITFCVLKATERKYYNGRKFRINLEKLFLKSLGKSTNFDRICIFKINLHQSVYNQDKKLVPDGEEGIVMEQITE